MTGVNSTKEKPSAEQPTKELFKPVACTTPLNPCTFCGWPAELYQRSNEDGTYSQKAVMCSNHGDGDPTGDECPLNLPPECFYHATKREAIEYWNERTARGMERIRALSRDAEDAERYRTLCAGMFGGEHDEFMVFWNDPEDGDSYPVSGEELTASIDKIRSETPNG